jgi:pseudouridine kinase
MAKTRGLAVLCIGGAVIDRSLETVAPPLLKTSNPVRSRLSHGGVARNVAETLARLGCRVALASLVGDDAAGRALKAGVVNLGIDARHLRMVTGARTAEYTAIFHGGELFAAFADMGIFEDWRSSDLDGLADRLWTSAWVFADCNLPTALLTGLREMRARMPFRLAVDAVSVSKSTRLGEDLNHIDLLFLNRDEARAITGTFEPQQALKELSARGAVCAVLTGGPGGLEMLDNGRRFTVPALRVPVVNVSGAGDALIAGTLCKLVEGAPIAMAIKFGTACAAVAVSSPGAVASELSREKIEEALMLEADPQRSDTGA